MSIRLIGVGLLSVSSFNLEATTSTWHPLSTLVGVLAFSRRYVLSWSLFMREGELSRCLFLDLLLSLLVVPMSSGLRGFVARVLDRVTHHRVTVSILLIS